MRLFRRTPAPTPADHARALGALAAYSAKERVRARTRMMREQLGLPPAPELAECRELKARQAASDARRGTPFADRTPTEEH